MPLGNFTWNIGDINGDIYFDKHTNQKGEEVPFIRLVMICNGSAHAKPLYGLRIVAYGALAEMAYGYLKKGSRIGVEGHIQQRTVEVSSRRCLRSSPTTSNLSATSTTSAAARFSKPSRRASGSNLRVD